MIVVDHKISNLSVISIDDFEELKNITEKYGERCTVCKVLLRPGVWLTEPLAVWVNSLKSCPLAPNYNSVKQFSEKQVFKSVIFSLLPKHISKRRRLL